MQSPSRGRSSTSCNPLDPFSPAGIVECVGTNESLDDAECFFTRTGLREQEIVEINPETTPLTANVDEHLSGAGQGLWKIPYLENVGWTVA